MQGIRKPIEIRTKSGILGADLTVPPQATSIVVFAHGSGSSRHSTRNKFVANYLNTCGFGTLLVDLLTDGEEAVDQYTRQFRFDIRLLADRVSTTLNWLNGDPALNTLRVGLFGASTGSAAALIAAAEHPHDVIVVVSRGGRPDLAGRYLPCVEAPTLFMVGSQDQQVLELNKAAMYKMKCVTELSIVPNATHLFEEPGTLEEVARLSSTWYELHFEGPRFLRTRRAG